MFPAHSPVMTPAPGMVQGHAEQAILDIIEAAKKAQRSVAELRSIQAARTVREAGLARAVVALEQIRDLIEDMPDPTHQEETLYEIGRIVGDQLDRG